MKRDDHKVVLIRLAGQKHAAAVIANLVSVPSHEAARERSESCLASYRGALWPTHPAGLNRLGLFVVLMATYNASS